MDVIQQAEDTIRQLLLSGRCLIMAFSGGKDSSVVMSLVLNVAADLRASGHPVPRLYATHSDTGIDNPEITQFIKGEMEGIRQFSARKGLDIQIIISRPALNDQWAVRVIGRRNLPTFANSRYRTCTIELKVNPLRKTMKKLRGDILAATGKEPVVAIGLRFEESVSRANRMKERGDSANEVRTGEDGFQYISPIAHLTSDDVWFYIGSCKTGERESYSSFEELSRIYASAGGTT